MDIRQLKYFISVVETGSFYAAAESLFVSRPAISKTISNFEDEVGLTLFERSANGATINHEGELLLPKIKRIVQDYDDLQNEISELRNAPQTIKVGFSFGVDLVFLDSIQQFMDNNPNLTIDINHYQYEDTVSALKTGKLDVTFSGYVFDDPELIRTPVFRSEAIWGVRADSPMAKRGYITDSEIHSMPHCIPSGSRSMRSDISLSSVTDLRTYCKGEAPDLSYKYILNDNMFYLCKLVLQGNAIMPIGKEALPVSIEGISFLPCPEHKYYWEADAYYPIKRKPKKAVLSLIEALKGNI